MASSPMSVTIPLLRFGLAIQKAPSGAVAPGRGRAASSAARSAQKPRRGLPAGERRGHSVRRQGPRPSGEPSALGLRDDAAPRVGVSQARIA